MATPNEKRSPFSLAPCGILAISFLFVFLIAEAFLRLFFPQDLINPMAARLDSEIIYTLTPNHASYLKGSSTRMFHLKTNSLGMREGDIPFEKPSHAFRLLLLGDSLSMAEGVELEEIYLKQMDSMFKSRGIKNIETVNAAIRGYGNDQELIFFRRIGVKYNPDLVILAFCATNDIDDNWKAQLFEAKDNALVQKFPTPRTSTKYRYYFLQTKIQNLPGYSFFMSHSHLANLIRVFISSVIYKTIYKPESRAATVAFMMKPDVFNLTPAILKQWAREVHRAGAAPFILIIPDRNDLITLRNAPGSDIKRIDLAIENFCLSEKIMFLNLTPGLMVYNGDFESLWIDEAHLSPKGHRWVAETLFDELLSRDLIPHEKK